MSAYPATAADLVVHRRDPFNAEPPLAALLRERLTPVEVFYVRNHGPVPAADPSAWRLSVGGAVERPAQFSPAELRERFEPHTVTATVQCAGNRRRGLADVADIPGEDLWAGGALSTAEWTGVRLADLLAHVGPRPGGAHVHLDAPDVSQLSDPPQPYGTSIPLAQATRPEVLIAWAQNGFRGRERPLAIACRPWVPSAASPAGSASGSPPPCSGRC